MRHSAAGDFQDFGSRGNGGAKLCHGSGVMVALRAA
jgi:hypothetical protein